MPSSNNLSCESAYRHNTCYLRLVDRPQAGHSPLDFLSRDPRKYFYLGECLAMVDLSLMVSLVLVGWPYGHQ